MARRTEAYTGALLVLSGVTLLLGTAVALLILQCITAFSVTAAMLPLLGVASVASGGLLLPLYCRRREDMTAFAYNCLLGSSALLTLAPISLSVLGVCLLVADSTHFCFSACLYCRRMLRSAPNEEVPNLLAAQQSAAAPLMPNSWQGMPATAAGDSGDGPVVLAVL